MKAKLSERTASAGKTQRAILELLRTKGPMQRWQISAELGKKCDTTSLSLQKSGNIEQYKDDNRDPDPCNKIERAQAFYYAFVRDLDKPKGVRENTLKWASRVLRAAGWTVEPPNTQIAGQQGPAHR